MRPSVARAISFAAKGGINVRMISGDNLDTATAVAIKAGILTEEDAKQKYATMNGEEFRKMVGTLKKEIDSEGN